MSAKLQPGYALLIISYEINKVLYLELSLKAKDIRQGKRCRDLLPASSTGLNNLI